MTKRTRGAMKTNVKSREHRTIDQLRAEAIALAGRILDMRSERPFETAWEVVCGQRDRFARTLDETLDLFIRCGDEWTKHRAREIRETLHRSNPSPLHPTHNTIVMDDSIHP